MKGLGVAQHACARSNIPKSCWSSPELKAKACLLASAVCRISRYMLKWQSQENQPQRSYLRRAFLSQDEIKGC